MGSKAFYKRQGSIYHDLELYTFIRQNENNRRIPNMLGGEDGDAWQKGFEGSVQHTCKTLMRRIFKNNSSESGQVFNIKNRPFVLNYNGRTFEFPGGVLTTIQMGSFPYNTHLKLLNPEEWFFNVGRVDPNTFGERG